MVCRTMQLGFLKLGTVLTYAFNVATNPIYVFNAYILFSGLYNKSACLQVSTLTTRFSNTRFADDHFGLCPYFLEYALNISNMSNM